MLSSLVVAKEACSSFHTEDSIMSCHGVFVLVLIHYSFAFCGMSESVSLDVPLEIPCHALSGGMSSREQ